MIIRAPNTLHRMKARNLRSFVHSCLGGWYWLCLIHWLEERFPYFLGKNGQHLLIVLRKPNA